MCLPPWSADGNYLISCGGDKTLKLWSASRGTLLKTYSGHGYEVLDADGYDAGHIFLSTPMQDKYDIYDIKYTI